ncbi:hypothetical protein [Paenibacillus gallinarum]|uniref:Uncharacterized protein n=1 Tax=Paenibacillus gallinarum TaxID=2762232 RepID=A0ABR8SXX0_9BACL|nr:hypothetical protein [Paenibacillus gallinarum]MBD7968361.1 hypothetical protein [Paenibacillus gallinarum]
MNQNKYDDPSCMDISQRMLGQAHTMTNDSAIQYEQVTIRCRRIIQWDLKKMPPAKCRQHLLQVT